MSVQLPFANYSKPDYGTAGGSPSLRSTAVNRLIGPSFNTARLNAEEERSALERGNFTVQLSADALGNRSTPGINTASVKSAISRNASRIKSFGKDHRHTVRLDPPAGKAGLGPMITGVMKAGVNGNWVFEVDVIRAANAKGGARRTRKRRSSRRHRKTRSRR